ncbi:hypothetical protein [Streptomyces milbemycinicus]|uniref:hypothetical protein n=1 Tax=Streptomyces milbemycinicus TaxID=476552 RepID=UPI003409E87F
MAFTVRLAETAYLHPSCSHTDSPGVRRNVIQRADRTEERSFGSAASGGFDATDFAHRVDASDGDATAAVHQRSRANPPKWQQRHHKRTVAGDHP